MVDILHIDNLRDLETDLAVGVHTIALGDSDAKRLQHAYVGGAYATTFALVACSLLSPWTLIVVAGLPRALALSRDVAALGAGGIDKIIVVKTRGTRAAICAG